MDLAPYIESLRRGLLGSAAPGGKDVAEAAELLADSLEPAVRLSLLDALTDASDEITAALETMSVEVRLRGREAEFVVTEIAHPAAVDAPDEPAEDDSGEVARITLRLPEALKDAVDRAAAAESVSVNAWLVRAIAEAVGEGGARRGPRSRSRFGRRFTGYGRA